MSQYHRIQTHRSAAEARTDQEPFTVLQFGVIDESNSVEYQERRRIQGKDVTVARPFQFKPVSAKTSSDLLRVNFMHVMREQRAGRTLPDASGASRAIPV